MVAQKPVYYTISGEERRDALMLDPTISRKVLITDDEPGNRELLSELVRMLGGTPSQAEDGLVALEMVKESPPDLILLDIQMPRLDGLDTCRALKSDPKTRLIPVIIITSMDTLADRIRGIEAGCDEFLSKPVQVGELLARMRSLLNVKHLNESLESAENVIFAMARAIEAKDKYTEGHTERVTAYAQELGRTVECTTAELAALWQGGILHDLGKIGVPDHILNKPGPLTPEEFEIVKQHPVTGYNICQPLKSLSHSLPCIRWHHEKPNGTGYPDRLKGDAIPKQALILAVADVYDALASERPYRKAMPQEKAFSILNEEAAKGHLDPELVSVFIKNNLPALTTVSKT